MPGRVTQLPVDRAISDADLLINVMRDVHPGYTRYRSEEAAVSSENSLRAAAESVEDSGAFYLAVSEYLASIRCEHTEAEMPSVLSTWMTENPTMLPISFEWIDDTAIVTGVAPGVSGIAIGDGLSWGQLQPGTSVIAGSPLFPREVSQ